MKVVSLDRIYQLVIVALILLLLWKWNCGGQHCPTTITTVKIDSFWRDKPKDSSEWTKPEPVKVTPGMAPEAKIVIREIPGTNTRDTIFTPVDTAAILADYYARADYDTTYKFDNGNIQVQNSVSQNRIQAQRVLPTFKTLEVIKTVTVAEKKKRQVYFGLNGFGGRGYPFYGATASLTYKDRKDRMFEAGPMLIKDQPVMIQAGVKFLISFK